MGFVVLYISNVTSFLDLFTQFSFFLRWRDAGHTFVELVISIPGSSFVSFGFSAAGSGKKSLGLSELGMR